MNCVENQYMVKVSSVVAIRTQPITKRLNTVGQEITHVGTTQANKYFKEYVWHMECVH